MTESQGMTPFRKREIEHWKKRARAADLELRAIKAAGRKLEKQVALLEIAIERREIVQGFWRFSGHARTDKGRRREYINKLLSDRVIPCEGIERLSGRTLRRWCELYRRDGDAGGIRALADRVHPLRGSTAIGDAVWAFLLEIKHTGTGITLAVAYEQVVGYIREKGLAVTPRGLRGASEVRFLSGPGICRSG